MTTKVAPVEEYKTQVPPKRVDHAPPPISKSEGVPPTKRLVSLDAFRGFTMFWIIGGAAVFRALPDLTNNRVSALLAYETDHTPWQGLRYYDLIWPCFMLMVGASVAFSYASRSRKQTHRQMMVHACRRAAILFLLGSLRTSISSGHAMFVELSSALQPIALAYFVAFLLARQSARFQAAVGVAILIVYGLLLHFVPAPGIPAGSYQMANNLVTWVDLRVLGRAHPEGWGTVLSMIPTISTTVLGLLIGELLLTDRSTANKMKIIGTVGISGVILGLAMNPFVPVVMKLWTTSYGILSAGWACLLFLLFFWLIDARGDQAWSFVFVVVGMNAIAAYMAGTLVSFSRIVTPFTNALAVQGAFQALSKALAVLIMHWLVLYWMYRRRIFIKV